MWWIVGILFWMFVVWLIVRMVNFVDDASEDDFDV